MLKPTRMALTLLFTLCTLSLALGQEMTKAVTPDQPPVVTVSTTAERVRIAAPSAVVQLRLEVYDEAGQKLFDTEQRGGNVLDWHLQGSSGERVGNGTYLCVVTSKNLTGRLSQKMGMVSVNGERTEMRAAAISELSLRQTQTVGPMEGDGEGLAVIAAADTEPVTVLTNTGEEGQLTRTRGALTFRVGDFFSGNDKEQMRLTGEGNLGIGIAKPKAKLDVAGMIRAREGFAFSDGSKLNVNDKGALTLTNSNGTIVPNVAGSGTQDRLAKWAETGGAGALTDSTVTETGGKVGIGVTNPTYKLVVGPDIGFGLTTSDLTVSRGPGLSVSAYVGANGSNGMNFGWDEGNQRAFVNAPVQSPITFTHGGVSERMRITTDGNVGIGTPNPGARLDVAGDVNTSTQYNISGTRVLSIAGIENTFAGPAAGLSNTIGGGFNSFFGSSAGYMNTGGDSNSFFGRRAGYTNQGDGNSFFGVQAGESNNTGGSNSFFGVNAGVNNIQGDNNTIIGHLADVGANNLNHATAIGAEAVVSSSDTIALGRADGSDLVDVPGKLQIDTMAATGGQPLCLNNSNRVTMCPMSSLRYKTHVHLFLGGLNIVRRLRPISFTWKEDGSRDLGLGAEEVARVEPLLIFRNKRGQIEGVKYNQVSAVLVNAVKEQQQQIQELQREVVSLKSRIGRHHRPVSHRWS